MENMNGRLQEQEQGQEASFFAPKNQEKADETWNKNKTVYAERPVHNKSIEEKKKVDLEKMEKTSRYFKTVAPGTFLYAIVYAICMYDNLNGITVPFGVGATLYFFFYYAKKFYGTARKCNIFMIVTTVILGILTCTTNSEPLIFMNKLMMLVLVMVYLLELFFDVTGWRFQAYVKAGWNTIWGGVSKIFRPLTDGLALIKLLRMKNVKSPMDEKKKERNFAIFAGLIIAVPIVSVLIFLLSGADLLFKEMSSDIFEYIANWEFPDIFKYAFWDYLGKALVVFVWGYGTLSYISSKGVVLEEADKPGIKANPYIALSCSFMIAFVYVFFVGIQILGLFMGALELPDGYTYAEYARQGFFQLTFVCFFNVCMVLFCMACFEDNTVLKWIMVVITGCTYVMLISAAYRMLLYISVYHLTFLRVFVLWAIGVMAIVMIGTTFYIFKKEFPIFKYMLACTTVLYIVFSAAHPDYWIAKVNICRAEEESIDEYQLIYGLSLDAAVPVLDYLGERIENPKGYYNGAIGKYCLTENSERVRGYCENIKRWEAEMNWRTFNFSKAVAVGKLREYEIPDYDNLGEE